MSNKNHVHVWEWNVPPEALDCMKCGEYLDCGNIVEHMNELESQLSEAKARLAGYEEGYDPKVKLPDDDEQVITFVNSKNWCFSNKDILSYLLKRHYLTDSTRWFPLPGSKEDK